MSNRCNIERLQNDAPRGSTSESSRMTLPMNPPAPAVPRPPTIPPPPHQLQGSLDRIMATMNAIQAEQKRQSDALEEFLQSSYSIEKSGYKNDLLQETGALFCATVDRLPEHKSILNIVHKVLRGQISKRYKMNAAVAFVKTRLGELRAEERRRVFGVAPCQLYTNLKCEAFVEKFLPVLKVNRDVITSFPSHVAIFRKYCRTVLTSKHNTYKGFQQWLNMNYTTGKPSDEELAAALQEEDSIVGPAEYSHLSPLPEDVHGDPY
eukprot:Em0001g3050a